MKLFKSVLFVPLLAVVGVQNANAQPASLSSIYRNSKVQVVFSSSTSLETSSFEEIKNDSNNSTFVSDPGVSFKIPGIEGKKATAKSIRRFSLDSAYCKQPVEYFEIKRAADKPSGTLARTWRTYATASKKCPSVTTTIDFTKFLANMTGHIRNSAEEVTVAEGEGLVAYVPNRGAVDVGLTSATTWEAIVKYKNGKIIKMKFRAHTV